MKNIMLALVFASILLGCQRAGAQALVGNQRFSAPMNAAFTATNSNGTSVVPMGTPGLANVGSNGSNTTNWAGGAFVEVFTCSYYLTTPPFFPNSAAIQIEMGFEDASGTAHPFGYALLPASSGADNVGQVNLLTSSVSPGGPAVALTSDSPPGILIPAGAVFYFRPYSAPSPSYILDCKAGGFRASQQP